MRLSSATLGQLSPAVLRPAYERDEQAIGIVHLGLGAFHRAHQAVYTDAALSSGDRDWAIAGVSLRSAGVRAKLRPQDGLYTVTELKPDIRPTRLIGAIRSALVAGEDTPAIVRLIADPRVHIVTLTVTEKGYHRTNSGDLDIAAVAADLGSGAPLTIYGFLKRGLSERRMAGLGGITILSCDNLVENGSALRNLLMQFLSEGNSELAHWFDAECACPCTMVDRIVPATTKEQLERLRRDIGLRDEAAVFAEPFSQWVIEDRFAGRRPSWEVGGAEFVEDVRQYEKAKLRMLNGAHSALAYLGLEQGHRFVHEAIAAPEIFEIVEEIMRVEAASTLASNFNSQKYADNLLARFRNPALEHRLAQIAMDGSQKIPQRWLATLAERRRGGRSSPAILRALAAWVRFIRGDETPVDDPMADKFARTWATEGAAGIVAALFGRRGLFAAYWVATDEECSCLIADVSAQGAARKLQQ